MTRGITLAIASFGTAEKQRLFGIIERTDNHRKRFFKSFLKKRKETGDEGGKSSNKKPCFTFTLFR